jgi:hypothetical protein
MWHLVAGVDVDPDPDPVGSASFCRIWIRIGIQGLPIRTWIQYPDLFLFQPNVKKKYTFSGKYQNTVQKFAVNKGQNISDFPTCVKFGIGSGSGSGSTSKRCRSTTLIGVNSNDSKKCSLLYLLFFSGPACSGISRH